MSRTFSSLGFYNYRMWFIGALIANIGTWMQRIAQDWLVLTELTDNSGFAVGIVTALQFLPGVFLTPVAGVLTDRFNRRRILIATQTGLGILAAALGAMVLAGVAELWHVYIFALLLGVVSALDAPARQVFVSELVPANQLANAVGLNSASFNAARLVGPGVAGLGIALVGTGWIFIINAVSFAATIGAMWAMRVADLRTPKPAARAKGQLREGLAYVRHRSDIVVILVTVFVVSSLGMNFQLTSAVMAREVFERGAGEYGLLGSVMAIGSLGGALAAARRSRPRVRLVLGAAFGFGVSSGLMAIMPSLWTFSVMSVAVGFFTLTMITAANTTIQLSTEPEVRGRVMSLYLMVFFGSNPVGAPIIGWIAENWGARWSIGVGAIASVAVAVGAAMWARRAWNVDVRARLQRGRLRFIVTHPEDRDRKQADLTASPLRESDEGVDDVVDAREERPDVVSLD